MALLLNRQVQFELCWQLLLTVKPRKSGNGQNFHFTTDSKPIREVDSPNPTICVNLYTKGLNIVCPISTPSEVCQVELDLVPAIVQSHGHRADEGLYPRGGLRKEIGVQKSLANSDKIT